MSVTVRINIHLLTYYCNKQIIIIIDNPFNLFSSKFQNEFVRCFNQQNY